MPLYDAWKWLPLFLIGILLDNCVMLKVVIIDKLLRDWQG